MFDDLSFHSSFPWLKGFKEALIRLGAALPLGGSRLVVARKEEVLA